MEKHRFWKSKYFSNQSLRTKLILPVIITMAVSLGINLLLFGRIDTIVKNMDQVYATNIRLGELEGLLTELESNVYQYLNIQSQEALEAFERNRNVFEAMVEEIDDTITDHPARRMERNIRSLALSWLELTDEAIQAKKRHDVTSYKASYEEIQKLYTYLQAYIRGLDDLRFKANSENYDVLYRYLRYLEVFMIAVLIGVTCCLMALLYRMIGTFTRPLEKLAGKAKEVGRGNFGISLEEPESGDEVGTVTVAFNQMIASINDYIRRIRESMEMEIRMKERELAMENLLKDAQLKYYQAQINPHFLFNTLNAGAQLAMMEGADRTYDYIQNVADFFRYNVKKGNDIVTLREELELIDHYIYILNVRFSGDIHYEKEISEDLLDCAVPSMILQPIVENCVNHGIREMSGEGRIWLKVYHGEEDTLVISIRDNGIGMDAEIIEKLKNGTYHEKRQSSGSNGIAMGNVIARLKLFTQNEDVMTIRSDGRNQGTEVILYLPVKEREKADV